MKILRVWTPVSQSWRRYDTSNGNSALFQFAENLKSVKNVIAEWTKQNSKNSQKELQEIKSQIAELFSQNIRGIFSDDEKKQITVLEETKRKLLEWKEAKWRMKSLGQSG